MDSIVDLIRWRTEKSATEAAYFEPTDPGWKKWTWADTLDLCERIARGLRQAGVEPGDRVAIMANTSCRWIFADYGTLLAHAAVTTVYPNNTMDETAWIVGNSGSKVLFLEGPELLSRVDRAALPDLTTVVLINGQADGAISWLDFIAEAPDSLPDLPPLTRDDLACLMYTSGTTGRPKGVELTHGNFMSLADDIQEFVTIQENDAQYLFLPLSHVLGKILELLPMKVGTPSYVDGRIPNILAGLASAQPTFMAAVPRVFEKILATVTLRAEGRGGVAWMLFRWARNLAQKKGRSLRGADTWSGWDQFQFGIADKLVISKVRTAFGGRIRAMISGGAPLDITVGDFFGGAGMPIHEGYGMTETSALSTVNPLEGNRPGSVGVPAPCVKVRIAEDGEVMLSGGSITRGYWKNPEATAETIEDGWLHTGDIGRLDEDGYLYITGRKKELLITSGGKNVAPAPIEGSVKANCPYIANAVMIGDQRKFCSMLVAMNAEGLAENHGITGSPVDNPTVHRLVQEAIDATNADLPRYAQIKKFVVLPRELTVEDGELTTSMKLKRRIILDHFSAEIDSMYGE